MNPHTKETKFDFYLGEKNYKKLEWHDIDLWVEVGGLGLIICTVCISTGLHCNPGFRLVDENNEPLQPYRVRSNRLSAHFSMEPEAGSVQDLTPVTFHMIANCKYAKLQVFPADGYIRINAAPTTIPPTDAAWNHKTICTMSVIPLIPNYQGGANTIFSYPQSRMPSTGKEGSKGKKSSKPLKKNRPNSNY